MSKKKSAIQNTVSAIQSILKDERYRIVFGFLSFSFAALLTLSFISFFFTWTYDQSQLEYSSFQYYFNSNIDVKNWGAKVGAKLSKLFIHDLFGLSSFSFILLFIVIGFRFFKKRLLPLRKSIKYIILYTIVSSLALGYIFFDTWDANIGGAHGYFIAKMLISLIGKIGAGLLIFTVIVACLLFTIRDSILSIKKFLNLATEEELQMLQRKIKHDKDTVSAVSGETDGEDLEDFAMEDEISTDSEVGKTQEASEPELENEPIVKGSSEPEVEIKLDLSSPVKQHKELEGVSFEVDSTLDRTEDEVGIDQEVDKEEELELDVTNRNQEDDTASYFDNEALGDYDPTLELSHYKLPDIELLENYQAGNSSVSEEELIENKNKIVETLANYKIQIDKIKATIGPTVTLYEIVPAPGIRISKIKSLEDDIALSLAALGIRIIAPIPGKGTIGIEVPNKNPQMVSMRSIIASKTFQNSKYDLPLVLGKTISNETYCVDLTKMPHLLIAGATGQGKSVGLNAVLTSLLYKKHPSQLKFVLVDPKKVELTLYSKIEKHFLAKLPNEDEPIITDTQKVVDTLNSLCIEMDERYELLKMAKQRNLKEYNEKYIKRRLNPELGHRFLPYIVVVIDEFADLIMTAGKEVELPLARLAQLARAIGIHLIIATQRPTTNIITGVIKANFPARIAFRVSSSMDSRTILDSPGANQLIGKGDMLISQGSDMIRLQCAFVDTPEIERITDFIGDQQGYASAFELPEYASESGSDSLDIDLGKRDALFEEAARLIVMNQQGSTSLIQRKFSIGYNRAGRIVDQLEAAGVVGPFEGSKARQVLITDEASLERLLDALG